NNQIKEKILGTNLLLIILGFLFPLFSALNRREVGWLYHNPIAVAMLLSSYC
ncbi:MAG: hypothetical protein ACI90V_011157, partial [Bacillariaceae sp.]